MIRTVYTNGGAIGTVREVDELMVGVGECDCIGCGGSGIFTGHPEKNSEPCVECKGTGKILVSI